MRSGRVGAAATATLVLLAVVACGPADGPGRRVDAGATACAVDADPSGPLLTAGGALRVPDEVTGDVVQALFGALVAAAAPALPRSRLPVGVRLAEGAGELTAIF